MTTNPTVPVVVRGHDFGPEVAPTSVMVEIRGPDRSLADRRMLTVNASATPMQLSGAGPHEARAILASGRVIYHDLEYNGATPPPPVHFDLMPESPHETLQRTATVHRLRGAQVGSLISPAYLSAWVQLWQRTPRGWIPSTPELDLRGCNWDHDAVRLSLKLRASRYILQVGAPAIPPVLTSLPGMGTVEVVIRPITEADRHPIELLVTPASADAATLLGYLGTGSVTAVETMLETSPLVRRLVDGRDVYDGPRKRPPSDVTLAEQVLYHKLNDPNTAALGGYHLLRTGDLDRMHSWPANLAEWIKWLPDGAVIRGWQLLRGGTPRRGETPRQRFLQAASRGVPCYAEGLRLLIDGLKVVWRTNSDDGEVAAAIEQMGAYAAATDWSHAMLSFSGETPDTPTESPRPGARSGEPATLMLHSITVEDLVKRHIVLPGTTLRATPRPARSVAAAFANETIVTANGLLEWGPWSFADPSSALIGTQADLMDGWAAWQTPDGRSLNELQQEARQRAPITGENELRAILAEAGVSGPVLRLLAAGGISSIADMIAAGPDRLAKVAGIRHGVAALVFRTLEQELAHEAGSTAPQAFPKGAAAKKTAAKKTGASKAAAKKTAAKKTGASKAAAKKTAAKKTGASKAAAKKTAAKKTGASKAAAKKTAAKKTGASKAAAKKTAAKKTAASKAAAKKTAASKAAAKTAPEKAAAK